MYYTFFFKSPDDNEYVEYTSGTLWKLTDALASPNGEVDFQVKVSGLNENETVSNVKVFLTASTDLGVYNFNPTRPLASYQGLIEAMTNPSGLFFKRSINDDWFKFTSRLGNSFANGFLVAESLENNSVADFKLKFISSNDTPSERLFIGLDVAGNPFGN